MVKTKTTKIKTHMPSKVQSAAGRGRLYKGRWNQFDIIAWDFTQECTGKKCELYRICEYRDKKRAGRPDGEPKTRKEKEREKRGLLQDKNKCRMQLKYMKNALAGVILLYGDKGGKNRLAEMVRVGYHLLPLYNQLFQFLRLEYAEKELMTISERGAIKINPLYKEIREIISSLEAMWTKIDAKVNPKKRKKDPENESDEDYLDAMYEVVEANTKALPLKADEDTDIFEEAKKQVSEEMAGGMDFSAGILPDKPPKKKKTLTKAEIQAREAAKLRKEREKKRKKQKEKREEEKRRLKILNERIKADIEADRTKKIQKIIQKRKEKKRKKNGRKN